ncbi:FmdB family zinc ribbon protein [Leifsonia sp. NPDC058248]|uniref:FmdB family zinc ribbon protein n=1 Tax=Leifsonia sp. NPDC058248 TaxID=3346402 RepID=UPI0036DB8A88
MPTYAYRCRDCGTAFDIQQAFTDDALTVCPTCGGSLRKVFGTVGVTFNGSGFYRTDSRGSSAGAGGSDSGSSSGSSSSPAPSSPAPAAAASTSSTSSSSSSSPSSSSGSASSSST